MNNRRLFFEREKQGESQLLAPQISLLDMFESPSCDVVVFTYDQDRVFRYVSRSIQSLCGLTFPSPSLKTFDQWLSDHPSNSIVRTTDEFSWPIGQCHRCQCEVTGANGLRTKLALRRHVMVEDGQVVGIMGLGWLLEYARQASRDNLVTYALGISESSLLSRWKSLTVAELEVLEGVVAGELNKCIAKRLSLAERTVEARRSRMMKKLGVQNLPQLVRFHMLVKHTMDAKESESRAVV